MTKRTLTYLAEAVLIPMLPGAVLEDAIPSSKRDAQVARMGPQRIAFKADKDEDFRLVLYRPQPFGKMKTRDFNELDVVLGFSRTAEAMQGGLESHYRDDVLAGFERRIVAWALSRDSVSYKFILAIIKRLLTWSALSYEGGRISTAIALDLDERGSGPSFEEVSREDAAMVLANGYDTVARYGRNKRLIEHHALDLSSPASVFSACRMSPLTSFADCAKERGNGRIVFVLNRAGELLIFHQKRLVFARRFGKWFFLNLDATLHQMLHPHTMAVRTAVLASAIDASFARTGACIGAVAASNNQRWQSVVCCDDRLWTSSTVKARMIRSVVADRAFQDIDRRLRQELLAIDGATLIDHNGRILAVGAILKVPGGSIGGGRRAAAIELGHLGMGLKISQDGGIVGFKGGPTPSFEIMA